MSAPMEVVVCSDSAGQLWNCAVFELHSGTNLLSYRGGNTSARGLAILNGEHLLGAQLGKNYINVWEIQRKDQLQQKIVCPGIVTCLTGSPNGLYLLAGIAESIYLWEVSTGSLLAVLNRHYQDLTCLRFTDDSSHFISGGKDNLALVWSICSVLQEDPSQTPEPRHVWARHSLPITDIHCGLMGPQARVATASLDQTVKVVHRKVWAQDEARLVSSFLGTLLASTMGIEFNETMYLFLWEISSGEILLSVLFDVGIMSVTFDPCEYSMFCGGSDGNIFQVTLCGTNLQRDKSFQTDQEGSQVFKGHRNLVTCLSVSMDGTLLLSGSHDETVRLWDIQSKQCVRTVNHKVSFRKKIQIFSLRCVNILIAPPMCNSQRSPRYHCSLTLSICSVTNAFIMPAPANMFQPDSRPTVGLPRFTRHLNPSEPGEGSETGGVSLRLGLHMQGTEDSYLEKAGKLHALMCAATDKSVFGIGENTKVRVAELEDEVKKLKKINKDLYEFSAQILTKPH
ncbi:WDR18 protein, partial [Polyodon spathula]|nr:WDR18 protein [Polyodon spathula]